VTALDQSNFRIQNPPNYTTSRYTQTDMWTARGHTHTHNGFTSFFLRLPG